MYAVCINAYGVLHYKVPRSTFELWSVECGVRKNPIGDLKQTDFFLHAHTFSMVSESRRNPNVAPSVSGTQLRNPCWTHAETVRRVQKHGRLSMKTPFSCWEHDLEYFAHAWISLAAPWISFVCFYTLYPRGLVTTRRAKIMIQYCVVGVRNVRVVRSPE
jgi:hypothetical protein